MRKMLALAAFACFLSLFIGNAQNDSSTVPSWDKLKAAYDYDSKTIPTVTVEAREDKEYVLEHLTFKNQKGQKVAGLFLKPKGDGKYPCVLLLHGLTSNKETMNTLFGRALAKKGIASLALDADLHGERKDPARPMDQLSMYGIIQGGIVDYRTAMDYLKTRKDVDSDRIGLLGYSMGAIMGSILGGVDERVKAAVLCVGGDPIRLMIPTLPNALRAQAENVCPSNYVGHISPRPVFMINGKTDTIINEQAAKLVHDAAKEPKEILWAEAGHILPLEVGQKGVDWLSDKLKK